MNYQRGTTKLGKKCLHPHAFGLEVVTFTAQAAKTKERRKRDPWPLSVLRVKGREKGAAMGVNRLAEHSGGQSAAINETRISKNGPLISLISHGNWRAGWSSLTKLMNSSNSTREHDTAPRQWSMHLPKQSGKGPVHRLKFCFSSKPTNKVGLT